MTGADPTPTTGIRPARATSGWRTLRRGLALSPSLTRGLWLTLVMSVLSMTGRVVVPIAVQQTVDRGLLADGGPRPDVVTTIVAILGALALASAVLAYTANVRLYTAAERGLAELRVRAFRHVHDLAVLTQNSERRGAMVSRVTSDVDTVSTFVQWGGMLLLLSAGQLVVATVIMAVYSWQLTLLVWALFLPVMLGAVRVQNLLSRAYGTVRERVGDMLGAVSESVLGATTIRAYGVADRTQRRLDASIAAHRDAAVRAQWLVAANFSGVALVAGVVVAAVVVVGAATGVGGALTLGELLAFVFLVQLFTSPVQMLTEVISELQNALAGWRRVMTLLDTPTEVADPGAAGTRLPAGPLGLSVEGVRFAYPGGAEVLHGVDLTIAPGTRVAVVGETGSGKSTLAKLLTRLVDPTAGAVRVGGVDVSRVPFEDLRRRMVLVPQEGFLFEGTLADNVTWALPDEGPGGRAAPSEARRRRVTAALVELGLADWLDGLPAGLDTPVGPRGESLSAGERQLVSLARAYLADPDVLVLDEATSSVDPATEVRLQRALASVTRGRTSVAIAHRLSTAETADLVVVVDAGHVVAVGAHADLLATSPVYARLHESWSAQTTAA